MAKVGSPHVKLLYDIYHMQIMEGDVIRTIAISGNGSGTCIPAECPGGMKSMARRS